AELFRQFRLVGATVNRRDLEPHVPSILHTQMTKAADTEHSNKIPGLRRCVSQGAERRDPRTQQRRRIDGRQVLRDGHEPARRRNHDFGISAIMMNAGKFLVAAVHEIAIAAELAIAARAAEKPDTHALTDGPALDTGTKRIDPPDDLMAGNARPVDRKQAFHRAGIRVAHPASLDANAYLVWTGIKKRLSYFRELSRSRDLDRSVCCVHFASDFVRLR